MHEHMNRLISEAHIDKEAKEQLRSMELRETRDTAHASGSEEGRCVGAVMGELNARLRTMKVSSEDREFLQGIAETVSELFRNTASHTKRVLVHKKGGESDEYRRRFDLLLELFGSHNPVKMIAGPHQYHHSTVYQTAFKEVTIHFVLERKRIPHDAESQIDIQYKP
jgi:hypothetical protein